MHGGQRARPVGAAQFAGRVLPSGLASMTCWGGLAGRRSRPHFSSCSRHSQEHQSRRTISGQSRGTSESPDIPGRAERSSRCHFPAQGRRGIGRLARRAHWRCRAPRRGGDGAPLGCRSSLSRVGDDGGLLAVGKPHVVAGHGWPAASSARDAHRSCSISSVAFSASW